MRATGLTGLRDLLVCESGTNPSRVVDRLGWAALVQRVVADDDRRHVALPLTGTGPARGRAAGDPPAPPYRDQTPPRRAPAPRRDQPPRVAMNRTAPAPPTPIVVQS